MAKFACARCKHASVGKTDGLCIRCTFAVESHQDRIARLDQAKAEQKAEKRGKTYGQRDHTFSTMRVRDTYTPPRPYRQAIGPAQCTAKVIREMLRWGTKPGMARTRRIPPKYTEYVKREPRYLTLNKK